MPLFGVCTMDPSFKVNLDFSLPPSFSSLYFDNIHQYSNTTMPISPENSAYSFPGEVEEEEEEEEERHAKYSLDYHHYGVYNV